MSEETVMSKGVRRVRLSFNPSGQNKVDVLKKRAAELIDEVESIKEAREGDDSPNPYAQKEIARLKALAQTAIEEAAMWAVKAATFFPPREVKNDNE